MESKLHFIEKFRELLSARKLRAKTRKCSADILRPSSAVDSGVHLSLVAPFHLPPPPPRDPRSVCAHPSNLGIDRSSFPCIYLPIYQRPRDTSPARLILSIEISRNDAIEWTINYMASPRGLPNARAYIIYANLYANSLRANDVGISDLLAGHLGQIKTLHVATCARILRYG